MKKSQRKNERDYIHYLYKITNVNSGEYYIGVHSLLKSKNIDPLEDGYWGSGTVIKLARKLIGESNFKKEILSIEETRYAALNRERELVSLETLLDPLNYNISIGGQTSKKDGAVFIPIYVNNRSKVLFLSKSVVDSLDVSLYEAVKDEPQYVYEKHTDTITIWSEDKIISATNKKNNKLVFEVLRPVLDHRNRDEKEKAKIKAKNTVVVVRKEDPDRKPISMDKNDPRYLSGDYVGVMKGVKLKQKRFGPNTSGYNTKWITNGVENKKIKKGTILPDGWRFGRVYSDEIIKRVVTANLKTRLENNKRDIIILNKITNRSETFNLDLIFFDSTGNLITPERLQCLYEPLNSWTKVSRLLNICSESIRKIREFYISLGYQFSSSAVIHRPGRNTFAVNTGRKVINKDGIRKVVDPNLLQKYLDDGWQLGSKPNK